MEVAPPITAKMEILKSFEIKQDNCNYKLNLKVINEEITINLIIEKDFKKEYEIKSSFDEIKKMHILFSTLLSSEQFVNYFIALIENKKLFIKAPIENKITIELTIDYMFQKNIISFVLIQKKINYELIIEDLYNKISTLNENNQILEHKYQCILEENRLINEENKNIKERLNNLENIIAKVDINSINKVDNLNEIKNSINSSIMEKDEFDLIYPAIKERINQKIKEIKKIYQAKNDCKTETFHQKCDNIKNTLILYKSAGNRRFGAFASKSWKSKGETKVDKKCFLFSLDKKKIYLPKNDNYFKLSRNTYEGPSFLLKNIIDTYCISIQLDTLGGRSLKTYEKKFEDIFEGDGNALSNDGNCLGTIFNDYEVFQIIF